MPPSFRGTGQKSGLGAYYKPCHMRIVRMNKELHGGARNYHLRRRYGITAEHLDRMFAEQGGLCKICREAPGDSVQLPTFHLGVHVGAAFDESMSTEPV
jgi:hypothetical protein